MKMSIFKIASLLSLLLAIPCTATECPVCEVANGVLMMRQIPGSEPAVKEYFAPYSEADTIYAIIDPVGICQRCEGGIMPIFRRIKALKPDAATMLIAGYNNKAAARQYLRAAGISADTVVYDTEKAYNRFLSCNIGMIHIPYLIKVVPSTGEIPLSIRAFSNSTELIAGFLDNNIELEPHAFAYVTRKKSLHSAPEEIISPGHTVPIVLPDSVVYSEPYTQPDFNGNILAFNDRLGYRVMLARLSDDGRELRHYAEVRTDSAENYRFIRLSDKYSRGEYDDGSLRFMPITPRFMPDGRLAVSYSLPHLWEVNDSTIGYANQPCMLYVDTVAFRHHLVPIEDGTPHGLFFGHYSVYPAGRDIAMMSQPRTWPLSDRQAYEDRPTNNPFVEEYYDDKYVMSVFSADSGRYIRQVCPLPSIARASKTGHVYMSPIADTCGDDVAYCDGISGKIYLHSPDGVREYEAFHLDPDQLPAPDSTKFHTYDISAMYEPYFCRHIDDMKLTPDSIVCIVRYGRLSTMEEPEAYTIATIARSTGKVCERRFEKSARNALSYGLRRMADKSVRPFRIVSDKNGWSVEFFNL